MVRGCIAVVGCLLSVALGATTNDLEVAKSALRDGLWDVARTHASKSVGNEARLVILESYANEGLWDEIGKRLSEWTDAVGGAFEYYRAAAVGDFTKAIKLLKSSGSSLGEADARMMEAILRVKAGDMAEARRLWAEVVTMTNVSERAFTVAAVNLGNLEPLRKAYSTVRDPSLKRLSGLRYGMCLLNEKSTENEGARIIRAIVKDSPDSPGALDAFIALAEADLAGDRWQEAASTYHEMAETWPESSKLAKVQEGRGWALLKLKRYDEAVEAFRRAEMLATDDSSRATALLKLGDTLSEMGRGEEAMDRYREVIAKYPKTKVAEKLRHVVRIRELEAKGRELYKEFRFAEAEKAFTEVAEQDAASEPRMRYFQVLCQYGQGLDDAAGKRARDLVNTCDDVKIKADATLWLAKFLYNRSEWKESGRLFSAFAELKPDSPAVPEALTWSARAAFAENDFNLAIQRVTKLLEGRYAETSFKPQALLVQGESLIELARFDEAVLVLEGVAISETALPADRMRAQILRADAFYAMGADNPARYQSALEAYRAVRFGGALSLSGQLAISFKIARTLEKLKRMDEAVDQYYTQVVLAYHDGRERGETFDDEARADFSRAAFRLVDEYESRGQDIQALNVLDLLISSDVPAAEEAAKRKARISRKGRFL